MAVSSRVSINGRAASASSVKAQLKAALKALNVYEPASRAWIATEPRLIRAARRVTGRNQKLIERYFATHSTRKLHIGCGDNELGGWLNTELCPRGEQIFLDATKAFPFADNVFALIYSEHMIEHIALPDAARMLSECCRVMKPGGIIRIVTPNLEFLTTLLESPASPQLRNYIAYSMDVYRIQATGPEGTAVFNNFMRAWGHQYIHNAASLGALMSGAGFEQVERLPLNDSSHAGLSGLAKATRMPAGFLEMESFVLEGRKPGPRG